MKHRLGHVHVFVRVYIYNNSHNTNKKKSNNNNDTNNTNNNNTNNNRHTYTHIHVGTYIDTQWSFATEVKGSCKKKGARIARKSADVARIHPALKLLPEGSYHVPSFGHLSTTIKLGTLHKGYGMSLQVPADSNVAPC